MSQCYYAAIWRIIVSSTSSREVAHFSQLFNGFVVFQREQIRVHTAVGQFSGTISTRSQRAQCRIILLLQPITKLYLFTIELKLRDDFRYIRTKICSRTFSTVPLYSPTAYELSLADDVDDGFGSRTCIGIGFGNVSCSSWRCQHWLTPS